MRNIIEYPVTNDEILLTLKRMQEEFINDKDGPIGSLDGVILEEVHDRLKLTVEMLTTMSDVANPKDLIELLKDVHDVKD